jgi:hypothetical protein
MNEPAPVPPADPQEATAESPLDTMDAAILDQVRAMHDHFDPPPLDLNERVQFAIGLETCDIEVSRLLEDTLMGADTRAAEGTRAVTFEAENLTIMAVVTELRTGSVRVEGWLAPAEPMRVVLRVATARGDSRGRSYEVRAEQNGRFTLVEVPAGLAQILVYRLADDGAADTVVVTSPLRL